MPIEPIPDPDKFLPSDMVDTNPEGSDSYTFGDDHIRMVKLALKNLNKLTDKELEKLFSYFDSKGRVKLALRAKEAERLSSDSDLSLLALKDGDYPDLRAQATTKYDVGLHLLLNMALSRGFDPTNMSYTEYLSLGSLKDFKSDVERQIADKLAGELDDAGLAEIDGDYPNLRAIGTQKEDIGLKNFGGLATADKAFAEAGNVSISPFAVVTAAYAYYFLNKELYTRGSPQTEYLEADAWGGTTVRMDGDRTTGTLRTVTFSNLEKITLAYEYWMEWPEFYISATNETGYDFDFIIYIGNSQAETFTVKADGTVVNKFAKSGRLINKNNFNPTDRFHSLDISVATNGAFTGNLTIGYGSGKVRQNLGCYVIWNNRNIGAK